MSEPKLRFKADDGSQFPDLKKISLESLMTFKNGINADGSKFGHGVKCISVMDILNNAYITHDIIKGAVNIDEKTLSNFSVEYGDVLFQRSSENVQDAGRANVYIDKDKIATYSGFVIRGKKISEYEPVFMNNLLNTFTVRKQIMSKAQGAQHINIGQEILSSIAVKIPCLPEQQKIASLFSELDALIQSAEKELDGYREFKQGMLQKMFPKKGEKVPEIRFPEFTGDWEQHRLSEICGQLKNTINPMDTPDDYYMEYSMPAFDDNETATCAMGKTMNSARKVIDKPCLLVNKLNVRKKRIWNVENPESNAVCSAEFVPLYSLGADLTFVKYTLFTDYFTSYLEGRSSGSSNSQKRVTPDVIMQAKVTIPTCDEQKKIGEYFSNLDNLITLQQQELDGYKELKKGLLQQMFC